MKKLYLIVAAITIVNLASATQHSTLNLKLWNNSVFNVMIDNRIYPATNHFFDNCLQPGNHRIQVFKKLPWSRRYGNRTITLYEDYVNIPFDSKIFATVKPGHIAEVRIVKNIDYCNNDWVDSDNWNNNSTMNDYEFSSLISTINNANFEDNKITIARQAINSNCLTSQQVRKLLANFNFEDSKLEIAKYAYQKTIDKGNYFIVNDVFNFESSITELNDYIIHC